MQYTLVRLYTRVVVRGDRLKIHCACFVARLKMRREISPAAGASFHRYDIDGYSHAFNGIAAVRTEYLTPRSDCYTSNHPYG